MSTEYKHFTAEDRVTLSILHQEGLTKAAIARKIGVHRSSVTRELNRNTSGQDYHHEKAQQLASSRVRKRNPKITGELQRLINEGLQKKHSPEQIAGRLAREKIAWISYESIYKYVWADKKEGGVLYKNLRHSGKKYNKRSNNKGAGRGLIPRRVDIKERPAIVETKTRIGDLEIDLIIGAHHKGALLSVVDRHSKYAKLAKLKGKTKDEVTYMILKKLRTYKDRIHTMTFDNGKEFAGHETLTHVLQAPCYFATPYHSWERGLNEHTNGLVRQYFPKKMALDKLTCEEVQFVEDALNHRPRKILNFATPHEVFTQTTCVALQT